MRSLVEKLLLEGNGVLRLAPAWVPRSFCRPGKRIKLHPDDYFALGLARGGIDERWFASTTHAENGPGTPSDEGMSYIVSADGTEKILLKEAVDELKGAIIGDTLWEKYKGWPIYSKLFDNLNPLPHHVHHDDEAAGRVGRKGKHEMYFYPAQLNNHGGEFPYTFFGFNPGVTKEQVKAALMNFAKGDNRITNLSRAYKLTLDTGFDVPPGILHAPGSLCTYEPQIASDVYAMYQSVLHGDHAVPEELLWKDTPPEEVGNYDYLMSILDWDTNTDPDFYRKFFMAPRPVRPVEEMQAEGCVEEWICYKSTQVCAKRLTVMPGAAVTIRDRAAYGLYMLQGHGRLGVWEIETPSLIRYGQLTHDEFFVTGPAAAKGVTITNISRTDPVVLLKHFPENPDLD